MLAMSAAQKKQQEEAEGEAREQSNVDLASNISGQRAAQFGFPAYGQDVAQLQEQQRRQSGGQNQNWMASLLPILLKSQSQGGQGGQ